MSESLTGLDVNSRRSFGILFERCLSAQILLFRSNYEQQQKKLRQATLSRLVLTSFAQLQHLRLLKQDSPPRRSKLHLKPRAKNLLICVLLFNPFLMPH